MYINQFTDLGKRMRTAQKEYFKKRSTNALIDAKELERQFDLALVMGVKPEPVAEKQLSMEPVYVDVQDGGNESGA